jgi:hypothetical protein
VNAAQVREALAASSVKLPLKLTYHDTGHSLDRGIEWLAKPLGRDTLLIAVNADGNPVDAAAGCSARFRRGEPMFESRSVAWTRGELREHFEPFGTCVWWFG